MPATGTQLASVQAMSATSCPSVYHPTISEYYPLVLRLGDYLRCILCPADWPLVESHVGESGRDDAVQRDLQGLLSGVLVALAEPQAASIKDAWPTGGLARVGLQLQTQVDVSV